MAKHLPHARFRSSRTAATWRRSRSRTSWRALLTGWIEADYSSLRFAGGSPGSRSRPGCA
jgi:hypothetical protein